MTDDGENGRGDRDAPVDGRDDTRGDRDGPADDTENTPVDRDGHGDASDDARGGGETLPDGGESTVPPAVFDELFATIEDRKREPPDDSYTASLFTHEKGIDAVLEKLGEESTELTLAAKEGDREAIRHESADLVYHLFVLLAARDLTLDDLRAELHDRFG